VALLILGLGVGFNEYQVQAEALELSRDVSAAQVIHLADLEGLEQRYMKLKNRRRFFDWGLRNIEESLKSGWMGIADRVINDYHKDKPTLGQKDWNEARQSLGKIMNYFPNDPTAKGKAHYCDGLIAFMNGLDDRRNNRSGNPKFREALNHFRDAELLLGSWPDPHLGMAMVYSYGALDVKLAATEIGKLREMGFALGEQREHAMRADGLRVYADELYNRAKKLPTLELSELQEIRAMYQEALDHYNQILDFSVNARREGVGIPAKLREIDLKILMLENQE
jgi:hypothetical protein